MSSAGGSLILEGQRLDQVSRVLIAGSEATLVSSDSHQLLLEVGPVATGVHSIELEGDFGRLTIQDGILVKETGEVKASDTFLIKYKSAGLIKMYALAPVGAGKVQFLVNGKEVAWIRAQGEEDPKLRTFDKTEQRGGYFVRSVSVEGATSFAIALEGVVVATGDFGGK
jgi:hypothetical protein